MKKFSDKYSWLIILLLAVIGLKFCTSPTSHNETTVPISLKNETKKQDSLEKVNGRLDSVSKILTAQAYRSDSVADHYKGRYVYYKSKFLSQKDSVPCYTEVKFITQYCDSALAQDSINNANWKALHKIDSTEIANQKNLHSVESVIIEKQQVQILKQDTTITNLTHKLKWQKIKTKLILGAWVIREAVGVGMKIKQ